jgi:hypothetical protein
MTTTVIRQQVWREAYRQANERGMSGPERCATIALKEFDKQFPPSGETGTVSIEFKNGKPHGVSDKGWREHHGGQVNWYGLIECEVLTQVGLNKWRGRASEVNSAMVQRWRPIDKL